MIYLQTIDVLLNVFNHVKKPTLLCCLSSYTVVRYGYYSKIVSVCTKFIPHSGNPSFATIESIFFTKIILYIFLLGIYNLVFWLFSIGFIGYRRIWSEFLSINDNFKCNNRFFHHYLANTNNFTIDRDVRKIH